MDKLQGMRFWDYAQLVMLSIFFITLVYRSLRLKIRRRINPFKLNFRENILLGMLELSIIVAVTIWAVEVMFYSIPIEFRLFPWPLDFLLIGSITAKICGCVLCALAFSLLFLGLRDLGDSWRFGIDELQVQELVTGGIYRFTRNPIFLFFILWFVGTFLINGTLIFLCFTLFTIGNLLYQILKEEEFLRRVHGSIFIDYCKRTPRYFSWRTIAEIRKVKPHFSTEF